MTGSGKISFRQGAKGYRHIGTYAKLLQRGMKGILPKMAGYVLSNCSSMTKHYTPDDMDLLREAMDSIK
jgi:hypothetical protein